MLQSLPSEILQSIGAHLPVQEYQILRTSIRIKLSIVQKVKFQTYRQITSKTPSNASSIISPRFDCLSKTEFEYISRTNKDHFLKALKSTRHHSPNALLRSCQQNTIEITKQLLLDKRYTQGQRLKALKWSVYVGHVEQVKLLIQDQSWSDLTDILHLACELGQSDIVDLLIKDGRCDPMYWDGYCLDIAVEYGNLDVLMALLRDPRLDPTCKAFTTAIDLGYIDIISVLLNDGRLNPCYDDNYALKTSIKKAKWDIVELLINDVRVATTGRIAYQTKTEYTLHIPL